MFVHPVDLFTLDVDQLENLNLGTDEAPRKFGSKNAERVIRALDRARTSMPLHRWLYAMGVPQIGESAAREVSRYHRDLSEVVGSELLKQRAAQGEQGGESIFGAELGPVAATNLMEFFGSDAGRKTLTQMEKLGIHPQTEFMLSSDDDSSSLPLTGLTFVITGTLSSSRDSFRDRIEKAGGKVASSVSGSTDYLLAGEKAGSKREKAEKLGVKIISEQEFENLAS
jgi:DNA ligase (NAD+)